MDFHEQVKISAPSWPIRFVVKVSSPDSNRKRLNLQRITTVLNPFFSPFPWGKCRKNCKNPQKLNINLQAVAMALNYNNVIYQKLCLPFCSHTRLLPLIEMSQKSQIAFKQNKITITAGIYIHITTIYQTILCHFFDSNTWVNFCVILNYYRNISPFDCQIFLW